MSTPASEADLSAQRPEKKRSWQRRVAFWLLFAVYIVALMEIASRGYLKLRRGVRVFTPSDIRYTYYPELREEASGAENPAIQANDATFDVLLLGASTLTPEFGTIAKELETKLSERLKRPVRIYNLAKAGNTTRDDLLKMRYLCGPQFADGPRFDLVIVYNAINDLRMNICAPEDFKSDYTHCAWYKKIDLFETSRVLPWLVSPYVVETGLVGLAEGSGQGRFIRRDLGRNTPGLEQGSDLKTPPALRANLEEIIDLAQQRGEPIVISTLAYYLPDDYTIEKFDKLKLDYAGLRSERDRSPVELWGRPQDVTAGIAAHNEVIRDVVAGHTAAQHAADQLVEARPGVMLFEADNTLPKSHETFEDCCHLTEAGCSQLVDLFLEQLGPQLDAISQASAVGK